MSKQSIEVSLIKIARSFLGLNLEETQKVLGGETEPMPGDEYGKMKYLTSLENIKVFPGTIFLENNKVEIVRVNRSGLIGYTGKDICSLFNDNTVRLRSPAGKRAHLLVNTGLGVACSTQGDALDFLEVFNPCTQFEYETRIYKEPPAFIR